MRAARLNKELAMLERSPPPGASCWGLREMIVIQPAGEEILGNETRARMVVGAVNIALHNTGCPVACLVQVVLKLGTNFSFQLE